MKKLTHIYTGSGKGKTTSAAGLAVRARSRGLRVLFARFMKEGGDGEVELLRKATIDILLFDRVKSPLFSPDADRKALAEEASKALDEITGRMKISGYEMVVLDEFNCLVSEGLITEDRAVDFIKSKPDSIEMVLTGRGATPAMIEAADYVTEMKEIKHPFSKGVKARRGIEH